MNKCRVFLLALSTLCAGCVYGPQQVRVAPQLNQTNGDYGTGKTVRLLVVDERTSKYLGQTEEGADFTLQGKLPNVVEAAIRTALEKQGFNSSRKERKDAANLHVGIRRLEYNVKPGYFFRSVQAASEINVICKSASGVEFIRPYTGLLEKTKFFIGWSSNDDYLSAAVTEAINKLLDDKELKACLVN